jgi:hypothetical protein
VALLASKVYRGPNADQSGDTDDWENRVYFVCCDNHGGFSPVIYMRLGGGRAAFDTVRAAAPFMRASDACSSAAGLCGFLFKRFGYKGSTEGTLSLDPPPQPRPDGTIDWTRDGDVILINVDERTAKCCFGSMVGHEVHNLPLGGHKIEGP